MRWNAFIIGYGLQVTGGAMVEENQGRGLDLKRGLLQ